MPMGFLQNDIWAMNKGCKDGFRYQPRKQLSWKKGEVTRGSEYNKYGNFVEYHVDTVDPQKLKETTFGGDLSIRFPRGAKPLMKSLTNEMSHIILRLRIAVLAK